MQFLPAVFNLDLVSLKTYDERDTYSAYDSNDEIESEADDLLDFTQSNPFGNV